MHDQIVSIISMGYRTVPAGHEDGPSMVQYATASYYGYRAIPAGYEDGPSTVGRIYGFSKLKFKH